jgi:hypothetical protein
VKAAEDDYPLPGVNIFLKGTERGVISNVDGKFEFHELREGDVLVFCFIGLETKEYRIKNKSNEPIVQMMMDMNLDVTGEVAVNEIYEPHPSGFQRLWSKVKLLF